MAIWMRFSLKVGMSADMGGEKDEGGRDEIKGDDTGL